MERPTSSRIPEYIFHYKCETEEKVVKFKFVKINGVWSLREIILYNPVDKI